MAKVKLIIMLLAVLCYSLTLTGCKDAEKEKAVAEATDAKAELAKVQDDLTAITNERDSLKSELAAAIQARDKLQAAADQATTIQEQLSELTKERDTAIAKSTDAQSVIEKLKSALQEQIQKVTGLEGQNKKLQDMIEQLKKQLGSEVKIPELPKP